jgi:hypothetical protein
MRAEVSNGHLAGEDECGGFSEESDKKQESACHLQHSGNPQQREVGESGIRLAVRETKQLLRSVFEKRSAPTIRRMLSRYGFSLLSIGINILESNRQYPMSIEMKK